MHLKFKNILRAVLWMIPFWAAGNALISAAAPSGKWSLFSPEKHCEISVFFGENGGLAYEASRDGKVVVQKSPLGLDRNDQNFTQTFVLETASDVTTRRETYDLFSGAHTHVDHQVNHRSLAF